MTDLCVGAYYLATDLVGFENVYDHGLGVTELRVKLEEVYNEDNVRVRTASLADSGTGLVLRVDQLTSLPDYVSVGVQHNDGLVIFAEGA